MVDDAPPRGGVPWSVQCRYPCRLFRTALLGKSYQDTDPAYLIRLLRAPRGAHLLQLWKHPPLEPQAIHDLLQVPNDMPRSSPLIARFREWYTRPIDRAGTYYLQVVQWLYKDNQLATGRFAALGRPIDLSKVRGPLFLLAARDDEIVAPEQLLAARHLVGSKERQIRT